MISLIREMEFTDFINDQYEKWRQRQSQGEKKSLTQFAEWLDVNYKTVYSWTKGDAVPSDEATIGKLAKKLGKGVYVSLGIDDPWAIESKRFIDKFSGDKAFRKAFDEWSETIANLDEKIGRKK